MNMYPTLQFGRLIRNVSFALGLVFAGAVGVFPAIAASDETDASDVGNEVQATSASFLDAGGASTTISNGSPFDPISDTNSGVQQLVVDPRTLGLNADNTAAAGSGASVLAVRQFGNNNLSAQFNLSRDSSTFVTQIGNENTAAALLLGNDNALLSQTQVGTGSVSRISLVGSRDVIVGHFQFGNGVRKSYTITAKPGTRILILDLPKRANN